jgi:hypothetical protein
MENNKTEILEMKNRDKEGWAQQYNWDSQGKNQGT